MSCVTRRIAYKNRYVTHSLVNIPSQLSQECQEWPNNLMLLTICKQLITITIVNEFADGNDQKSQLSKRVKTRYKYIERCVLSMLRHRDTNKSTTLIKYFCREEFLQNY